MMESTRAAILEHAKVEAPRESCGLVVNVRGKERYIPCQNLATSYAEFVLDPADYAAAEDLGDILAIVHSHPNSPPDPSQADRVGCEASGVPWHIVAPATGTWATLAPSGYKAPLVGRQYAYGILDCWTIVRDWFRDELGIALPDFDRPVDWWNKGGDLFAENYQRIGFYPVPIEEIRRGDVVMMKLRSKVINHLAIYLGNDVMLHHGAGRLSTREVFGGWWKKNTLIVARHRESGA